MIIIENINSILSIHWRIGQSSIATIQFIEYTQTTYDDKHTQSHAQIQNEF